MNFQTELLTIFQTYSQSDVLITLQLKRMENQHKVRF